MAFKCALSSEPFPWSVPSLDRDCACTIGMAAGVDFFIIGCSEIRMAVFQGSFCSAFYPFMFLQGFRLLRHTCLEVHEESAAIVAVWPKQNREYKDTCPEQDYVSLFGLACCPRRSCLCWMAFTERPKLWRSAVLAFFESWGMVQP